VVAPTIGHKLTFLMEVPRMGLGVPFPILGSFVVVILKLVYLCLIIFSIIIVNKVEENTKKNHKPVVYIFICDRDLP
jgi:hypothetical protein